MKYFNYLLKSCLKHTIFILTIFILSITTPISVSAALIYNVTDLTALGALGLVSGMNDKGQIVGGNYLYDNISGILSVIDTSTGSRTYAKKINNNGQIIGFSSSVPGSFTSDPATHSLLPNSGIVAEDINDNGQIVGVSYTSATFNNERASISNPDTNNIYNLANQSSNILSSHATALNNSGLVVGYTVALYGITHAFVSATHIDTATGNIYGAKTDLGSLAGAFKNSSASDINNNGTIVGTSDWSYGRQSAFIAKNPSGIVNWGNYSMSAIGNLFGGNSIAAAINDNQQVVGTSWGTNNQKAGFLYDGGITYNINDLIDINDPLFGNFTLKSAYDINSYGDIIGSGITANGAPHSFLLKAQRTFSNSVPEPSSLSLFLLAVLFISFRLFIENIRHK